MTVTSSARAVTVRAHAKINLDLRVLGTRPDGFHELRTVFQALALHDTIECVPRDGPFAIECETAGVPLDRSNLMWSAAEALWRSLRREGSVRDVLVRLHKRIPLQGGLGGGSADAAATLLALAHAWRVPLRANQFVDVASTLGADVPFFLRRDGARARQGRRDLSARRFAASLDRPADSGIWRRDRSMRTAGTTPSAISARPGSARRSTSRSVAVTRRTDDQRPRGADCPAPPRDRADEDWRCAGPGRWPRRCRAAARPCLACFRSGGMPFWRSNGCPGRAGGSC